MKPRALDRAIVVTCIAGILVSTYALYIEMAVDSKPGYKALCDISEHASCSRVLSSKYAKGFGITQPDSPFQIPNTIYGTMFYCFMIFLSTFDKLFVVRLQFLMCLFLMAACVYLMYILAFVLQDICVVCGFTYIVNIALTILVYKKKNLLISKRN